MKTHSRAFVLAVLFAIVSLAPALQALTGTEAKVNVPFAFNCGSRHFAPGAYTLDFLNMNLLQLRNGRKAALVVIAPEFGLRETKAGYAVFRKYGDQYFLEEIWLSGSTVHISLNEKKWERNAAKELASQQSQPSRIELALVNAVQPVAR